jgi:hypothetical protein
MNRFSLPLTRLVHENLSILMCFAYSQPALERMVGEEFTGEWKYLNKALFQISQERAEKACFELALFLRTLDDEEGLTAYFKGKGVPVCGRLIMKDNSEEDLTFREMTNKVIHTSGLEWNLSKSPPLLICHSRNAERWVRAEVDLVKLATFCGQLMS